MFKKVFQVFNDGRVEEWKEGRVEGWKNGRMEGWKDGRMEGWKDGRVEGWKGASNRTSLSEPGFPGFSGLDFWYIWIL